MTSEVRPFKIAVPEGELTKLKCKLNAASFPPDTAFSDDWERGSPQADVKRLVARWKEGFDWRAAEAELNKIPQFTTSVDVDGFGSIEMHFYEKLIGWSDDDYRWGDDEVLTWASLYVFSRPGPAASVRIYYEDTLGDDGFGDASGGIKESKRWNGAVPLGLSSFPRDMGALISSGRTLGPVVFERAHERGGHFPATERPEVLAGDLKDMFSLSPGGFGRAVQDRLKLK
ncbi:hypothetical protein MCOR27_008062 [Pyricularia oryzae]|uniref:Epoxide hydrolase N-terminal domain-containing protein n=1 Tax=Pyricularia grisea TaxID=148305 RepID=A0ABQ8NV89_PYRGI|nr:hypothetical protein MCOR01_006429 [Pyricularia oryzae]KAI6302521.1 hypothetical protein MCOR33_002108 [Pyricularia grisea]KAI6273035.1 hypothetical protein MCOR27_008062 [Pyricularia oryzae]KAI6284478.1 hypothetical protein MCOR26_001898 [Pyricularia oryzae]KAI6323666.1 hypothetical protein MCOR29_004316 [Pyricularia oryzae]